MKKNLKIFTFIAIALLLISATVGISALAADESATPTPTVEIYKKTVSYDDIIQLAYAIKAENMEEGQKIQLLIGSSDFTVNSGVNIEDVEGVEIKNQKPGNEITLNKVTYPVIFSTGIHAGDMTTDVYALPVITDAEGNIVAAGNCLAYSLYDYAIDRFEASPTADQIALYKALLDYGAAIQDIMLPEGQTTPQNGWADAYYGVAFGDTVLAHDGSFVSGNETEPEKYYVRFGESVELTAAAADKDGHDFRGFYVDGAQVTAESTYSYTTNTVGLSYVMAGYVHDFTGEVAKSSAVATAATATAFPQYYYSCTKCNEVNSADGAATFENGMKVIAQTTFTEDYSGLGTYYLNNGIINGTVYTGNKVASGSATFGTWKTAQLGNAVAATGAKHIFETDIMIPTEEAAKITMKTPVSGKDKNIGWFGLSDNTEGNSNQNIFAGFYVNVLMDESGVATGFGLSHTTNNTDDSVNAEYGAFNFGQWYNIRIEATANENNVDSVAEYYINGVHVGTEIFLDAQQSVAGNTKINRLVCIGRAGGTGDIAAKVNFANIFYGTETKHDHDYTNEVVSENYLVSAATTTTPAIYKKSCTACGLAGDETFYYGIPTFAAGNGVAYNNSSAFYAGTRYNFNDSSASVSTMVANNGGTATPKTLSDGSLKFDFSVYSVELIKNNYNYGNPTEALINVFETDITFGSGTMNSGTDNLAFLSFSNDKGSNGSGSMGYFNLYGVPVSSSDLTIASYELRGLNNKAAYTFKPGDKVNLRLVLNGNVVDIYVNGWLVAEDVAVKVGTPKDTKYMTGYGIQSRGVGTFSITLDNTFVGSMYPEYIEGTGVYYNGGNGQSGYSQTMYNFDNNSNFSEVGKINNNGSGTLTNSFVNGKLVSVTQAYSNYRLGLTRVSGTTIVWESDIMFTKGTTTVSTADESNIAYIGFANNWANGNGGCVVAFYTRVVKSSVANADGSYNIDYVTLGSGSKAYVALETGVSYNLRIVITDNAATETVEDKIVSIYLNGMLVADNITDHMFGKTISTDANHLNTCTNITVENRGGWAKCTGLSMIVDNFYLGGTKE